MQDDEVYPVGTVVRIKRTGQFALITKIFFRSSGTGFLNYMGKIEDLGEGNYAICHQDVELEALPPGYILRAGKPIRVMWVSPSNLGG
jgi:hypothetical protein